MRKAIYTKGQELVEAITESVKTMLNEIGYRTASLSHGANYNAMMDFSTTIQ